MNLTEVRIVLQKLLIKNRDLHLLLINDDDDDDDYYYYDDDEEDDDGDGDKNDDYD